MHQILEALTHPFLPCKFFFRQITSNPSLPSKSIQVSGSNSDKSLNVENKKVTKIQVNPYTIDNQKVPKHSSLTNGLVETPETKFQIFSNFLTKEPKHKLFRIQNSPTIRNPRGLKFTRTESMP
ncbi:hypothetical protein PanWU01x14_361490 [Parasponia andersonii]|uniref:Uncharacterized protein n=1 Tax=Parasponia andersonii TaxID=3476 RepID=A0A2P5A7B7_PARAD|nr:hypothetical protein PanWU01x14_361490 [Parasponia andersonii]